MKLEENPLQISPLDDRVIFEDPFVDVMASSIQEVKSGDQTKILELYNEFKREGDGDSRCFHLCCSSTCSFLGRNGWRSIQENVLKSMYESAKKNGVIDVAVLLLVVLFRKLSFYLPESEHVLLCGQIQTLYQTAQTTHPTPFNSSYFSSIDMTGFSSISLLGNVSLLSHLFPGIPFLVSVEPLLLERNSNPTKLLIRKTR